MGSSQLNSECRPLLRLSSKDANSDTPVLLPSGTSSAHGLSDTAETKNAVDISATTLSRNRHVSSKVWKDIRIALKAIGSSRSRTFPPEGSGEPILNQTGSETSMISPTSSPAPSHFRNQALVDDQCVNGLDDEAAGFRGNDKTNKVKDILRRFRANAASVSSNNTVVTQMPTLGAQAALQLLPPIFSPSSDTANSSEATQRSDEALSPDQISTRKTSVESIVSPATQNSKGRKHSRRNPWTRSSPEGRALSTIPESGVVQAVPTIMTVERAAAAKIFLETHFNELLYRPNMRNLRRQYLEYQLIHSPHLSLEQKEVIRNLNNKKEACHLRETRVMKTKCYLAGTDRGSRFFLDNYEPLKILGKGSFGVVRLIREKPRAGIAVSGQVYAAKVIRKSDMLRNSQEGHLKAERDFLVASGGSRWYVSCFLAWPL